MVWRRDERVMALFSTWNEKGRAGCMREDFNAMGMPKGLYSLALSPLCEWTEIYIMAIVGSLSLKWLSHK